MEFIYKLILVDRLFVAENWTEEDGKHADDHYYNLLKLQEENKLILAGKTAGLDTDTYGIVIFKANSLEEANSIMENDPAVRNGIMKGYLQEYNVALFNNKYTNKKDG